MAGKSRIIAGGGLALGLAAAVGAIAATDRAGSDSPRRQAAAQLIEAALAGDEAAMNRLLAPRTAFLHHSSFDLQIGTTEFLPDEVRGCAVGSMSEALAVVAVELECPGGEDRPERLILDLLFCDGRVAEIASYEGRRLLLTPLPSELRRRLFRWLTSDRSRCDQAAAWFSGT